MNSLISAYCIAKHRKICTDSIHITVQVTGGHFQQLINELLPYTRFPSLERKLLPKIVEFYRCVRDLIIYFANITTNQHQ